MVAKEVKISVALAVFNEEVKLGRCLESVNGWADEIVVVDGGSADRTIEIANKYRAKIIRTDNPSIFHINKQKAIEATTCPWVLQIDADEIVTDALKKEIVEIIRSSNKQINGYFIPRKNFFSGHWLHKGGQYPDYVIRLVKRGRAKFPCESVHEQIRVNGPLGYLENPLLHYPYKNTDEYWKKADVYTTLTAKNLKDKKINISVQNWLRYFIYKPLVTFFSIFIRHKGFMDGYYGFLFAWFSALHHPIAYYKYCRMNHENI